METELLFTITLFLLGIAISYIVGLKLGKIQRDQYWALKLPSHRKDAINRSRAVLKGQFSEQLAPYFPDFTWDPSECRFIGKPIDFIVFKGASKKEISEVIFVEVKSGKSQLSTQERGLRDAIKRGDVKWVEYRVPEEDL